MNTRCKVIQNFNNDRMCEGIFVSEPPLVASCRTRSVSAIDSWNDWIRLYQKQYEELSPHLILTLCCWHGDLLGCALSCVSAQTAGLRTTLLLFLNRLTFAESGQLFSTAAEKQILWAQTRMSSVKWIENFKRSENIPDLTSSTHLSIGTRSALLENDVVWMPGAGNLSLRYLNFSTTGVGYFKVSSKICFSPMRYLKAMELEGCLLYMITGTRLEFERRTLPLLLNEQNLNQETKSFISATWRILRIQKQPVTSHLLIFLSFDFKPSVDASIDRQSDC